MYAGESGCCPDADAFHKAVNHMEKSFAVHVRFGNGFEAPLRKGPRATAAFESLNLTPSENAVGSGAVDVAIGAVHASPVLSDAW